MPAIAGAEEFALRIPAGSKLIFQVHYTPNGTATTDQSEAAVCVRRPGEGRQGSAHHGRVQLQVPDSAGRAGLRGDAADRRSSATRWCTRSRRTCTTAASRFKFTARYPDGSEEILLDVPRYDFNWQNIYLLKKPKLLPAGTVVDMEAHFDNSADNPLNPDPTQSVHWGDQTWDEMMLGSLTTSWADQDLRHADGTCRIRRRRRRGSNGEGTPPPQGPLAVLDMAPRGLLRNLAVVCALSTRLAESLQLFSATLCTHHGNLPCMHSASGCSKVVHFSSCHNPTR